MSPHALLFRRLILVFYLHNFVQHYYTAVKQELLQKHRADVMRMVEEDPVLKKRMTSLPERVTAEAAAVAAQNAATVRATAASLQTLQKNCKSTIGRNAYNTVLAAVAGAGEHTCVPAIHATRLSGAGLLRSRMASPLFSELRVLVLGPAHSVWRGIACTTRGMTWLPRRLWRAVGTATMNAKRGAT